MRPYLEVPGLLHHYFHAVADSKAVVHRSKRFGNIHLAGSPFVLVRCLHRVHPARNACNLDCVPTKFGSSKVKVPKRSNFRSPEDRV